MYYYEKGQLWVRNVRSVGIIVDVRGARLSQIQRETLTKISLAPQEHLGDTERNGYKLCQTLGSKNGVLQALLIIEKLLGRHDDRCTESLRLDTAAQQHLSSQQGTNKGNAVHPAMPEIVTCEQDGSLPVVDNIKKASVYESSQISATSLPSSETASQTRQLTATVQHSPRNGFLQSTPGKPITKLPWFTLTESEEETSSSSSDDEDDSSSDEDSGSGGRSHHDLPTPSPSTAPPPPISLAEPSVAAEKHVVIKIEDDSIVRNVECLHR